VAEDNPDDSFLLTRLLEKRGHEVVHVDSGEAAWRLFESEEFGIVLSDLNLPGMNGVELIRRIRAHDRHGYTYIILISGDSEMLGLDKLLSSGADDFLHKPVEVAALSARLKVASRIAQMQTELVRKQRTLEQAYRQLAQAHEETRNQLRLAARVQRALLPSKDTDIPGLRLTWHLKPCVELAGDLLNCIRLDGEHAAFYVLDVSGHGVSAALLSVQISRLLSPQLSDSGLVKERIGKPPWYRLVEPLEVMQSLNGVFQTSPEITQYFTMIYGLLHTPTGRVTIACAGHPGPIVSSHGTARIVRCHGNPVGLLEDARFSSEEFVLQPGDRLWLYSDGITESADRNGTMFGTDKLRARIEELQGTLLDDAVTALMEEVGAWTGAPEPDDDCTLMALEVS